MLRIAFRADGGSRLGLGHLARCRSLMRALEARGPAAFTVLSHDPGLASGFLGGSGNGISAADPLMAPGPGTWDILIADAPGLDGEAWTRLSRGATTSVLIDDAPNRDLPCDVRVVPNLAAPEFPSFPGARVAALGGGRHLILDPAYADAAAASPGHPRPSGPLLVSFGGSDPAGFTLALWPLLARLAGHLPVRIVVGPAHPRAGEIRSRAAAARIAVADAPSGLLPEYLGAMAALLSGGTQLYEACCLGLPAVILSQNPGQSAETSLAAAAGAVVDGGGASPPDADRLASLLAPLLGDPGRRALLSAAGRRLADAAGTRRVLDAVLAAHTRRAGAGA